MIIWGSRAKEKVLNHGNFFCPNCRLDAAYQYMRVSRYFTLYFIPLFQTNTLADYVRCNSCGAQLKPSVLEMSRDQVLGALQPWVCGKCNNHNPPSEKSCLACGASRADAGAGPQRGSDLRYNMQITPEEARQGVEKELEIEHFRACQACTGTGCEQCSGQGRVTTRSRMRLKVPAGTAEGTRFRMAGNGDAGLRGGQAGDLYIVVHVGTSPPSATPPPIPR